MAPPLDGMMDFISGNGMKLGIPLGEGKFIMSLTLRKFPEMAPEVHRPRFRSRISLHIMCKMTVGVAITTLQA
ncbi:hypothetical protein CWS72_15785 [Telmatospirillum siberiense]|uniref:Uncharacterized protein n=1 Tax=Telmatospirillum siberiense TaxID=382514 RepID=A0A2N3PSZ3_9PROT|nr:hypothetical protein CWS72_15785 [Telmatospirillum siberiense]